MYTPKERLERISNLVIKEKFENLSNPIVTYFTFRTEKDVERESIKRGIIRDMKISSITGEEFKIEPKPIDKKIDITSVDDVFVAETETLNFKPEYLNLKKDSFHSWDDLYRNVVDKIDEMTRSPYIYIEERGFWPNWNLKLGKLSSKIATASNRVAITSRRGPGNSAIVGKNAWDQIMNESEGDQFILNVNMNVILDKSIDPNKIIVLRSSNSNNVDSCIFLIVDGEVNYFLGFPNDWDSYACWFWIE